MDGGWTAWFDWGDCNKLCDGGNRTRTRECGNPAPESGGLLCLDETDSVRKMEDIEQEACNTQPCKKC